MITGIFPPIATPFINDEIAFEKLRENISRWNEFDLSGYVVMGSNGESVFLTRSEKIKLVESVKKYSKPGRTIIAGTGLDSIKETISLSNDTINAGADYLLILTPSFYQAQMKHDALVDYFNRVADSVKVPVIIYNVPKFTNVNIKAETVAKLAEHQNIIGIKNSSENLAELTEIISSVPNDFSVLVGTASVLYPGLGAGAAGGIMAMVNAAPGECISIYKNFIDGNYEKCLGIQKRLVKPNKAVTATYGVAGLKAAMDMMGFYGGRTRSPLQKLSGNEIEDIKQIFKEAKLLK
jgi:4-hydroxy-tetrahydrodipicolinate synthase